jgi:hypothetical protein
MTNQVTNRPDRRLSAQSFKRWLILAAFLLLLIAAESFAVYTVFTSKFPSGNDFFVRWLGGREYLLHGTNPFDQSVAEKAQQAMFGRLTQPRDKDQAYFAYPLYSLYFFWPLSLLPYAWAQAIWMTLLQFMLLGVTMLSIRLAGWRPPFWLFLLTIFWGIFFYNGARAIILGQFSILVGLALLLALWAIDNGRDGWAGVLLSVTTIKPQMVFLILIFLLLWALVQRRGRLIISFAVSMLILVASSMLLIPTWPLDFVNNALAYSQYVTFGTPLENLLHYLLPASIAAPLAIGLPILFFLLLLPGWWAALGMNQWMNRQRIKSVLQPQSPKPVLSGSIYNLSKVEVSEIPNPKPVLSVVAKQPEVEVSKQEGAYTWAIMSTLIVGNLITFRSATTNQIILYLPLFFFFRCLTTCRANLVAVVFEVGLAIFMWAVFVTTIEGNWEHIAMHGLFPAIMLLLYATNWQNLRRITAGVQV